MFNNDNNHSVSYGTGAINTSTTMHNDNNNNDKSWQTHKNEGTDHFKNSNYTEALMSFQRALKDAEKPNSNAPRVDREILLSNSVACRLKIGGVEMACVAVEEAKKCIALNNKWAKAHVRLASAYIALGNHSNDACQALQNAIRLDPSNNSIAKQMLMKELRRDASTTTTAAANNNNNHSGQNVHLDGDDGTPTYVNENDYTNDNTRPSAPPPPNNNNNYNNNNNNDNNHHSNDFDIDIDDSPTFIERIQDTYHQFKTWYYQDASDNWKSLIQVICVIFVLYIAFGGRFGLDSSLVNRSTSGHGSDSHGGSYSYNNRPTTRGNYGQGNAYDRVYNDYNDQTGSYNRRHNERESRRYSNDRYDSYSNSYTKTNSKNHNNNRYDRSDRNDDYYERTSSRTGGRHNHNRNSYSDWNAIIPYILVVAIVIGLRTIFDIPIHIMPMGFGMGRVFGGGFGPGVRMGGGRMRFGGMRFGGGGGGLGRNIFNRRRGWY